MGGRYRPACFFGVAAALHLKATLSRGGEKNHVGLFIGWIRNRLAVEGEELVVNRFSNGSMAWRPPTHGWRGYRDARRFQNGR